MISSSSGRTTAKATSFAARLFNREYEASNSVPLRERISKTWASISLGQRQLMLFTVAESVVILLFFVQFVVFAPVLDEILLARSESELNLLETTYEEKVRFMGVDASLVAESHVLEDYLASPRPSEEQYYAVQELLEEVVTELHVEYASLVDLHVPATGAGASIRVSANGNRTGDVMEAAGLLGAFTCCSAEPTLTSGIGLLSLEEFETEDPEIWRERLSEFNPVAADHMVDLEIEGLIRWVLQPVYVSGGGYDINGTLLDMCTDDLAGVLVLGDLVNGKVPIVEETLERFDGGYSAVWYADSGAEMHQAISYMAFEQGTYAAKLAGVELESKAFVDEVRHAGEHHVSHTQEVILGNEYTMAGTRVDAVILVRGTDHNLRDEKENRMRDFALIFGAAVFVTDCIVLYLTMRSFVAPLEKLGRKLQFQGASSKTISQADLDKMPRQSEFYKRSAASQLTVIAALVTIVFLTDQTLFELQAAVVSSELEVMTHFYNNKIKDLSFVANRLADEDEFKTLADEWGAEVTSAGVCPDFNHSLVEIKHSLKEHAKAYNAELSFFLDTHRRVVVTGNGADVDDDTYMRCDTFDPEGIVSAVLDSPKEIRRTGTILSSSYRLVFTDLDAEDYYEAYGDTESELHPEITVDDLLIRWVAVPVFTHDNSEQAEIDCEAESVTDGVILLGEVLNGKLGLPGSVVDVFGDGYAGIYLYDEAIEDYVLVTSLLVSHGVVEADVAVDVALIDAAHESPIYEAANDELSIAGYTIPARTYSTKVSPVPLAVWIDAFGEREVDDEAIGFLVRGTSVEATDAVDNARQVLIIVTASGLVVAISLRLLLAYQSFLPAKRLIAAMKRAGLVQSGTSRSGTSRSKMSSSLSSTGVSQMVENSELLSSWQLRLVKWRYSLRRLDWENWVIMALLLSSIGALSVVVPLASHLDTSAQRDVIDLANLVHDAAAYMHNTRHERSVTGEMVDHGYTLDDEGEQQYDATYRAAVDAARHSTDVYSTEFLHTLTQLSTKAYTDTLVAEVKRVRKDVYSLREWRLNVDGFQFDTVDETDVYVSDMHDQILGLCETAVKVPEHADTSRLAFITVSTLEALEALSLEDGYVLAALHHGEFQTHDEFVHFLADHVSRGVDELATYSSVMGTEYGHWYDELIHGVSFDLTEAWSAEAAGYPAHVNFTSEEAWQGNSTLVQAHFEELEERYNAEMLAVAGEVLRDTQGERDAVVNETISALAFNVLVLVSIGMMNKRDVNRAFVRAARRKMAQQKQNRRGSFMGSLLKTTLGNPLTVAPVPEDSETSRKDSKAKKNEKKKKKKKRTFRWRRVARTLRRLRDRHIGVGLLVVLAAFLVFSCVVWTHALSEYNSLRDDIDELRELVDLAVQGGSTMHQTQNERYIVAEWVDSAYADDSLATALEAQRVETDSALTALLAHLRGKSSHSEAIDALIHEVDTCSSDGMTAWRAEVDAHAYDDAFAASLPVTECNHLLNKLLISINQFVIDADQFRLFTGFASLVISTEDLDLERALMHHPLEYGAFADNGEFAHVAEKMLERRSALGIFNSTLPTMVSAMDDIISGEAVGLLWAWEDLILSSSSSSSSSSSDWPTAGQWAGNVTAVMAQAQAFEDVLGAAMLADVERVSDEASETFVNIAVPHLWASCVAIIVLLLFYSRQYPISAAVFALTGGRHGTNLAGIRSKMSRESSRVVTTSSRAPPLPSSSPPGAGPSLPPLPATGAPGGPAALPDLDCASDSEGSDS